MPSRVRRLVLTTHITVSVGWIGAVIAFLALVFRAATTESPATLRGAWVAMDAVGQLVLVPLAVASLMTGVVVSLGSKWGLFRHYWVVISLIGTLFAATVLVLNMQTVASYATMAAGLEGDALGTLRDGLLGEVVHGGLGLVVLMAIQVLNVYKPRGMTRYGQRRQQDRSARRSGTQVVEQAG